MTVGERIKRARETLGLTQEELAVQMGYSGKSSVCKAETCGDDITTRKVKKFAKALNCSFDYLMGWETEFTPFQEAEIAFDLYDKFFRLTKEQQQEIMDLIDKYIGKN